MKMIHPVIQTLLFFYFLNVIGECYAVRQSYGDRACAVDDFICTNGQCIRNNQYCNNQRDCSDNSDEINCSTTCSSDEYRCLEGVCISLDKRCNGIPDCRNGDDEHSCDLQRTNKIEYTRCSSDEFECSDGLCIKRYEVCDGLKNCPYGDDESNCSSHINLNSHMLNIKVYPDDQIIKEGSEVVIQCRDEGPLRARVRWIRGDGLPLPGSFRFDNGRLEIPNIQLDDSGTYICEAEQYSNASGYQATAHLTVEKSDLLPFSFPKTCREDEAICSIEECIPKDYVCDGKSDCSDGSDEVRCGHHGCEPNEFRCANKQCVSKVWRCDGDDDCSDGTDEENCSSVSYNSPCTYREFKCSNSNQCIPKSYHCDHESDCLDGSDEIGCSPVYIVKPPPPMVILDSGDTLSLTCSAIGIPVPEINWRLNWGHIPKKCLTSSINGTGTLNCPKIGVEDQGAYSCEGINVMGFIIATPDSILIVKNTSVCPVGKFNVEAERPEDCISCFCFGVSTECKSANVYTHKISLPVERYKVVPVIIGPTIKILRENNLAQSLSIDIDKFPVQGSYNEKYKNHIIYYGLPEQMNGNQLKLYGGYLQCKIKYNGNGINNAAPNIIIYGNDLTLIYPGSQILPNQESIQKVRFVYGEWYRQNEGERILASREDIMMVLQNMDIVLIKAQYENSHQLNVSITNVVIISAMKNGENLVPYIEECLCPSGYNGLSCEICAPGYTRRKSGQWLGQCYKENISFATCPPTYYGDPSRGIPCEPCPCPLPNQFDRTCYLDIVNTPICNCPPGYEGKQCERCTDGYYGIPLRGEECVIYDQCNRSGSLTTQLDPITGRCQCKEYVTGSTCNQCKPNTFSLATTNQFGCISCFCMGITSTCTSSNWYRSEIRISFSSSNSIAGFSLVCLNEHKEILITSNLNFKSDTREIVFGDFPELGAGDVYYWQLPVIFLGNQISAYGGHLKYILRYIPSPGGLTSKNSAADVELISSNDITLLYYSRDFPEPNSAKTFVVPILEQYWQRSDGTKADREHLLMALADVQSIRIKATYTTHTYEAALSFVSLEIAEQFNTGKQHALEVEKCSCPHEYQGLSCENCAVGYTRAMEGLYLGICEPCRCNGHSSQCDPETGVCKNCADHTTGESCEICESDFQGNATAGTPYDCQLKNSSAIACHCNPFGSVSSICKNEQCECKRNVKGAECNHCIYSTFGLSQDNKDGCNECFCSGVTNHCYESSLYIQQIPIFIYDNQHGFTLTDPTRREVINNNFELNVPVNEIGYQFLNRNIELNNRLYWSLPIAFIGNKIKSYGGSLYITQRIEVYPESKCHKDQDVIISGNGLTLYWTNPRNITRESTLTFTVRLKESEWRHISSSGLRIAQRSDLMLVLANIDAILIRASFCDKMKATFISDISLDTAVEIVTGGQRATQVEECVCPTGYSGTSCEVCAPGYYRNLNDRSICVLGSCVVCPCNKREESCEIDWSGHVKCNCRPEFTGQYCQEAGNDTQTSTRITSTTAQSAPITVKIAEPNIQIVKIGDNVRYHCSSKSLHNNPVIVQWEKEGSYLPIGRSIDDSYGVLVIREVRVSDTGNYICRVSDGMHIRTEKVTLYVGDSKLEPMVQIIPPYLKVIEGEAAEFKCATTNPSQSIVQWTRLDGKINSNATFTEDILRIPSTNIEDAAEYKCIVRTRTGIGEDTAQLHVQASNYDPHQSNVTLSVTPTNWSGFNGDTVKLICSSSKPARKYIWRRPDRLLLPASTDQLDGILIIRNPSLSDSGTYICTATLHDGMEKSINSSITIYPRHDIPVVSIEPERQKVPQGATTTIKCRVEGDESNINWIKNKESVLGTNVQVVGKILRITNAQISNRGVYTCRLNFNNVGDIEASAIVEVEPREMPVLQIYPQESQSILLGDTIDFHCRIVAGIPKPEIKWIRQDNKPFSLNSQIVPGGTLRINNVTNFDSGTYVCIAENSIGITSASVNLEIQSLPSIIISPQNGILHLKFGDKLHLVCSATGYPQPAVSWSKAYNEELVMDPYKSGTFGSSATIDINSISKEDEGTYICQASSSAGVVEDYVQLRIENDNTFDYSKICRENITCSNLQKSTLMEHSGLVVDGLSNIPSGGQVSMRCKLFPYPEDKGIYLDWKRGGDKPMPSGSTVSEGTLFLINLQEEDSGEYVCFGIDKYGEQLFSAKTQLNVIDFPKVELRPIKQTVRPGESPSIHCIATGEKPLNIEWIAVGRTLPSSVSQSNGVLQFYGITFSDAGKYACKVWNDLGTAESVAEVSVEASISPIIKVNASKDPIYIGDSINLQCLTSGVINPRYVWSRPYEVSLPWNSKVSGNILSINDVDSFNSGVYRCAVDSDDGVVESDFNLVIQDAETPYRSYNSYTEIKYVPFGQNVELTCRDHLQTSVRYQWIKANSFLPIWHEIQQNKLKLNNVDENAAGTYICRGNNGLDTLESYTLVVVTGLVPYFNQVPLSFIELPPLMDAHLSFEIEISFRSESPDGILLYTSENADKYGEFLLLTLEKRHPVFRFDLGSGPAIIYANKSITLNEMHTIIIQRNRKQGTMTVDSTYSYASVSEGKKDVLDVHSPLYVGGIPEDVILNKNAGANNGFKGCINRLLIGGRQINLINNMVQSQSITNCETCGRLINPCIHGVCQESTGKDGYDCICNLGYTGKRCQNVKQSCKPETCGDGNCSETNDGYVCDCPIGKTGMNCEYSQLIQTPKLSSYRSYLAYSTPKSSKRNGL